MLFLAIETSCDETAAAVFTDEPRILANVIASQTELHARFGGVVPEVAARAHSQRLFPVIDLALGVPLVGVNHIEAHIYAARVAAGRDIFPCVGLVVSGGHTSLFHCRTPLNFALLGATIDDAAGEAFDKVASILGLGFPGGPAVEREAALGSATA